MNIKILVLFPLIIHFFISIVVFSFSACTTTTGPADRNKASSFSQMQSQELNASLSEYRAQYELLQEDLQRLTQQVAAMQKQMQEQKLLVVELNHQIEEKLIPAAQQLTQHNLKIHKQSAEFQRLQKNLRELRILVDESQMSQQATTEQPHQLQEPKSTTLVPERKKIKPSPLRPDSRTVLSNQSRISQKFTDAVKLLQSQQYWQAIEIFETIRQQNAQHPYAIEAHYWIGEAYFSLAEYQKSAIIFYDFVNQNPRHSKTLIARWKLAQALEKSGDIGLAIDVYNELAQSSSPYQEQAKQRLEFYEKTQ